MGVKMDLRALFFRWQARYLLLVLAVVILLQAAFYLRGPPYDLRSVFNATFLFPSLAAVWVWILAHSWFTQGPRATALFIALSAAIPFSAEVGGVNFGYVFGPYDFSNVLGPKVLGVPLLIAMAWEPILYSACHLADLLRPGTPRKTAAVVAVSLLAAVATVAPDLMIEGLAVQVPLWNWEGGGPYLNYLPTEAMATPDYWATLPQPSAIYARGVPISNFAGWVFVAFLVNAIYRIAARKSEIKPAPPPVLHSPVLLYLVIFVTVGGLLLVLNYPEVVMVGLLAMGPFLLVPAVKWASARDGHA